MSRCPYCRRELPGFETVCQRCFEAGYEHVAHSKSKWQSRQLWREIPTGLTASYLRGFLCLVCAFFIRLWPLAYPFHDQ